VAEAGRGRVLPCGRRAGDRASARPALRAQALPERVEEPFFFQKRTPKTYDWLETAIVTFPSGRHAEELVIQDAAHLVFACNLGVIDYNPWACRRSDLDHPDELRVDLDLTPNTEWDSVRRVALIARDVLVEHGLTGFPKTSGSRVMHVNARVVPECGFLEARRAALAQAREVERRAEGVATTKWWKEERPDGTVFVDFNQNARDRTVASAYSIRPTPDARVSCPPRWDEVADVEPAELRIDTVPARVAKLGDPAADIDAHAASLASLLALAARDEADGLGDAPWPPNFAKQPGEAPRVQPSRRRKPRD
jgi:bifunctional non-homologous end joining protein LigD